MNHLNEHNGYSRIFREGKLTFGFISPIEGYPDGPIPLMAEHEILVRNADRYGMAALWLRDVPFLDPGFGDAGQVFDPFVYAGWLSGVTENIAVGSAGIVLPLRDPIIVAKQAASADQLLKGRFLLGLASGDRPTEFPAFGLSFENRSARYRDAHKIIKVVSEESFPHHESRFYGTLEGSLDLIPKPFRNKLPILSIGRAGQEIRWIAENMDAWIWHGADARRMTDVIPHWLEANNGAFKPYGYATWFDLSKDPDEPVRPGRILKAGRNALIEFWKGQEAAGISHVALNLKQTRRNALEIMDELAEFVLPHFPAHSYQ
jgi:luciferase-type oxidoreductase